jgi:hypothetical protein
MKWLLSKIKTMQLHFTGAMLIIRLCNVDGFGGVVGMLMVVVLSQVTSSKAG